jgi:hypothetical protein
MKIRSFSLIVKKYEYLITYSEMRARISLGFWHEVIMLYTVDTVYNPYKAAL